MKLPNLWGNLNLPQTEDDWKSLEYEVQSLFSPAAPINEADLFGGRLDQIGRLTDAVFERGRHAVLYGERGVGKTSLANTFHMLIKTAGRHVLFPIRKQANPTDSFSSLWRRIFMDIEIKQDGEIRRISEFYPNDIVPDDILRELQNFSLNSTPIVIIDEFDKLTDLSAKKLLSHTMKAISDSGINATVLLVGVAEDVNLLVEEHKSIARNITEIKMPRMSADEMNEILDQRYPKVRISIEPSARQKIIMLARGLPEYVHFLGRDAAKNALSSRRLIVEDEDVDAAISCMVQSSDQTSEEAYAKATASNKANNLYRQVLLACALAPTDELGQFIPSDVLPVLTKILGRPIKIANFFPHIAAFCEEDRGAILEKKGMKAFKYRFKEPKMQPYVIMKGIAEHLITRDDISILSTPAE